jgi:hypothetical protein
MGQSASYLCWRCLCIGWKHSTVTKTEFLPHSTTEVGL